MSWVKSQNRVADKNLIAAQKIKWRLKLPAQFLEVELFHPLKGKNIALEPNWNKKQIIQKNKCRDLTVKSLKSVKRHLSPWAASLAVKADEAQ